MKKNNNISLLIWKAITPLHSGTGQSSSIVDLPIAREKATHFPIIPASSIKGVFRDGVGLGENENEAEVAEANQLYGYANKKTGEKDDQGNDIFVSCTGQITFTDARLLCLPVRSYKGTFAYVTCPLVIERLQSDLKALGLTHILPQCSNDPLEHQVYVTGETLEHNGQVLFEDIELTAQVHDQAQAWGKTIAKWIGHEGSKPSLVIDRIAIVSNDVFSYFSETATEVTAHIALEVESKTVKDGNLWYEETLPAESILASFLIGGKIDDLLDKRQRPLQIGGKSTVGKGLVSVKEAMR